MFESLVNDLWKLFFMVNPHIGLPIFLSMTQNYTSSERRNLATKACLYALCLGFGFVFGGGALLKALEVPVSLFGVGGGFLLGVAAWGMLYPSPKKTTNNSEEQLRGDPSLSPLAFPLITGPATLTALVSMAQSGEGASMAGYASVLLAFTIIMAITYAFFLSGGVILKFLGKNGCLILEKLGGIVLVALSATMIFGGLKTFFTGS